MCRQLNGPITTVCALFKRQKVAGACATQANTSPGDESNFEVTSRGSVLCRHSCASVVSKHTATYARDCITSAIFRDIKLTARGRMV